MIKNRTKTGMQIQIERHFGANNSENVIGGVILQQTDV